MQRGYFSLKLIAVSLIANVVIVWAAMLLLPSHASTLSTTNGVQTTAIIRTISNSVLKGDRLIGAHVTMERENQPPAAEIKGMSKIPVGCDAAFSKMVNSDNFAARCVTGIQVRAMQLASMSLAGVRIFS